MIKKICEKQMSMIIDNPMSYESEAYKNLELLKISIKDADKINELSKVYGEMAIKNEKTGYA